MGMQTEVTYGAGYVFYASDEELKNFILNHKETIKTLTEGDEILQYVENTPDDKFNIKEDFFSYENQLSSDEGIYGIVTDVIWEEKRIGLEYYRGSDMDTNEYLIFPNQAPWHMSDAEKALKSPDDLKAIVQPYMDELNPDLVFNDALRIEFYG